MLPRQELNTSLWAPAEGLAVPALQRITGREDAIRVLDEIKKAHSDAIKKATNKKKRSLLRRAYVRCEAATGVGTG